MNAAKVRDDGSYVMYLIPWDMDLDEILSFQKNRMRWLDTYFQEEWADMLTE